MCTISYDIHLLLQQVHLSTNFPCTLRAQHNNCFLTDPVSPTSSTFVFNQQMQLKGTTPADYIQLFFILNDTEGGRLHLQFQSVALRRGQQRSALKYCCDEEAYCSFQVISVQRGTPAPEPKRRDYDYDCEPNRRDYDCEPNRRDSETRPNRRRDDYETKTEYGSRHNRSNVVNTGKRDDVGYRRGDVGYRREEMVIFRPPNNKYEETLTNTRQFKKKAVGEYKSVESEMVRHRARVSELEHSIEEKNSTMRHLSEQLSVALMRVSELQMQVLDTNTREHETQEMHLLYAAVCQQLRDQHVKCMEVQNRLDTAKMLHERSMHGLRTQLEYKARESKQESVVMRGQLQQAEEECRKKGKQVERMRGVLDEMESKYREKCITMEKSLSAERNKHLQLQQMHASNIHELNNTITTLQKNHYALQDKYNAVTQQSNHLLTRLTIGEKAAEEYRVSLLKEQDSSKGLQQERKVLYARVESCAQSIDRLNRALEAKERELTDFRRANEMLGSSSKQDMTKHMEERHLLQSRIQQLENTLEDSKCTQRTMQSTLQEQEKELNRLREREQALEAQTQRNTLHSTSLFSQQSDRLLTLQRDLTSKAEELAQLHSVHRETQRMQQDITAKYESKSIEYSILSNKVGLLEEGINRHRHNETEMGKDNRILSEKACKMEESNRQLTYDKEKSMSEWKMTIDEMKSKMERGENELKRQIMRMEYQAKENMQEIQSLNKKNMESEMSMSKIKMEEERHQERMHEMEREKNRAQAKLKELQSQLNKTITHKESCEEASKRHKEENSSLKNDLHLLTTKCHAWEEEMKEMREEKDRLMQSLNACQQEAAQVRESVMDTLKRAMRSKGNYSSARNILSDLCESRSTSRLNTSRLNSSRLNSSRLLQPTDIVQSLESLLSQLISTNSALSSELERQIHRHEREMEQVKKRYMEERRETISKVDEIHAERDALIDKIEYLSIEFQDRYKALDAEYSTKCRRVVQLEEELEGEMHSRDHEAEHYRTHYADAVNVTEHNMRQIEALQQERIKQLEDRRQLEEENQSLLQEVERERENNTLLLKQKNSMSLELNEMQERMRSEQEKAQSLKEILEREEAKQEELKTTSEFTVQQKVDILNAKLMIEEQLQSSEEEKGRMRAILMETEMKKEQVSKQAQALTGEMREMKCILKEMESSRAEWEGRRREYEGSIECSRIQVQSMTKLLRQSEETLREREVCISEIKAVNDRLETTLQETRKEIISTRKESNYEMHMEEIRKLKGEIERLEEKSFLERQNVIREQSEKSVLREESSKGKGELVRVIRQIEEMERVLQGKERTIEEQSQLLRQKEEKMRINEGHFRKEIDKVEIEWRGKYTLEQEDYERILSALQEENRSLKMTVDALREELQHSIKQSKKIEECAMQEEQRLTKRIGDLEKEKLQAMALRKKQVSKLQSACMEERENNQKISMEIKRMEVEILSKDQIINELQVQSGRVSEMLQEEYSKHSAEVQMEREKRNKLQGIIASLDDAKWEAKQAIKNVFSAGLESKDVNKMEEDIMRIVTALNV